MFCTGCGNEIMGDARFCTNCGKAVGSNLGSEIAPPQTDAPPEADAEESKPTKKEKVVFFLIACTTMLIGIFSIRMIMSDRVSGWAQHLLRDIPSFLVAFFFVAPRITNRIFSKPANTQYW